MRKRFFITGSVAVLFVGAYVAGKWLTFERVAHAQVSAHPYTMEQWGVSFANTPNGELRKKITTAVRPDGSRVVVTVGSAQEGVRKRIDWADGRYESLLDAVKGKVSGTLRPQEVAARNAQSAAAPKDCRFSPAEKLLRKETLIGEAVFVYQVDIENSPQRITNWKSESLGCTILQTATEHRQEDGTFRLVAQVLLVSLERAEPDPRLFASDESYREMPPSQLKREYLASIGVTETNCAECFRDNWTQKDAEYFARRPSSK